SINAGNGYNALSLQVFGQGLCSTEVGNAQRTIAYHQAGNMYLVRFNILGIDAGIANVWVSQGNDLPVVAGVSQDFLITGHGGVEDDLSYAVTIGADRNAMKQGTVSQSKDCSGGRVGRVGK